MAEEKGGEVLTRSNQPLRASSEHGVDNKIVKLEPKAFFERNIQQREEIIEGLIREGQLVVLAGPFGVGKSPLIADLIMHILNGRDWCGRNVRKRPVISFDFENAGPTYKRNIHNICNRLQVPLPEVPDELEVYLEHDALNEPATAKLLDVLQEKEPDPKFKLIREALEKKPNALVTIDPVELLFPGINTVKKSNVLWLYSKLRFLLSEFHEAAILMTFNLRKKDRLAGHPNLLIDPRGWLEEVCGALDIVNRSDMRLGMDFYNEDIRVINGIRRGEDMNPVLVRPFGDPDNLAGFELCPADGMDLKVALPPKQHQHWEKLPQEFRFEEVANKVVPRASLHRLIKRAKSLGVLRQQDGYWVKAVKL